MDTEFNKDTYIVGDIHGRFDVVEELISWDTPTIFIGDIVDSYTVDVDTQVKTLNLVLNAVEAYPNKYRCIMGNHELSYLDSKMMCSGHNYAMAAHMQFLKSRVQTLMQDYLWCNGFLVTHAGLSAASVHQQYLDRGVDGIKAFLQSEDFNKIKYNVGSARGGFTRKPGIFWCDWWQEFIPIDGVNQVVGHSANRPQRAEGITGIVTKNTCNSINYNVDCLSTKDEILFIKEDGTTKFVDIF